jgi:hypothetical protein
MHGEMRYFNILDGCFNIIIGNTLINSACQVHNRDIWCWNLEGHASELASQLRKDFSQQPDIKANQSAKNSLLTFGFMFDHSSYSKYSFKYIIL